MIADIILMPIFLFFWRLEAAVLIFLLSIIPNGMQFLVSVRPDYIWAQAVIVSVEKRDVDALERMMCKNIRDNEDDLRAKIQLLYDGIDGDVKGIDWDTPYEGSISTTYKTIDIFFTVTTSKDVYYLSTTWIFQNAKAPDSKGIYYIALRRAAAEPGDNIVEIEATDGYVYF